METIAVKTPRGEMPVHIHRPAETTGQRLVVIFMDAPGIRPALHEHAERLAEAGYTAALPDLYYAIAPADHPRPARLAAGDPDEFARMAGVVAQMNDREILADTRLMLDQLRTSPADTWGCVGFCMGARFGLRAAEELSDGPAAASLLHPSGLVTDSEDSPHLSAGDIDAALYLGYGADDHVTPLETIPPLEAELKRGKVAYQIEIISGADHGFTMPGSPAYNAPGAERAWRGTLAVLSGNLRAHT